MLFTLATSVSSSASDASGPRSTVTLASPPIGKTWSSSPSKSSSPSTDASSPRWALGPTHSTDLTPGTAATRVRTSLVWASSSAGSRLARRTRSASSADTVASTRPESHIASAAKTKPAARASAVRTLAMGRAKNIARASRTWIAR